MSTASPAYFEIIDSIAAGTTPEEVVRFRPSPKAQRRVGELMQREKEAGLSPDERAGLDHAFSRKRGGTSEFENLAYACILCNRYKGSDVASINQVTRRQVDQPFSARFRDH